MEEEEVIIDESIKGKNPKKEEKVMPYKILYEPSILPKGRPWKIYNEEKKKIVGSSVTKEMAKKAIRARYWAKSK